MIDQKWSARAIPTIIANIMANVTAGTRITTLYRRPSAMPARTLIIANSGVIALPPCTQRLGAPRSHPGNPEHCDDWEPRIAPAPHDVLVTSDTNRPGCGYSRPFAGHYQDFPRKHACVGKRKQ